MKCRTAPCSITAVPGAEGAQTSWEAAWRVTGEKGTAIWDGHDEIYAEFVAEGDQSGNFIRKYERTEGTSPSWRRPDITVAWNICFMPSKLASSRRRIARQRLQHGDGAGRLGECQDGTESHDIGVHEGNS